MVQTNATVSGDVPLEAGDDLSNEQLSKYIAQTTLVNYVVRGCGLSADFGANTLDIGTTTTRGNFAVATQSNLAYCLFPEQATGISLPDTNGVNYVYVAYDINDSKATDVYYHVDDDDTPPAGDPSLKIGEVDTANSTTTELNRSPPETINTREVSSDYTTNGEHFILANTSSNAVTITLASADLSLDHPITIINLDGSNAVTVDTEAAETIDPGGDSSKSLTKAGFAASFSPDGSNWDSGLGAKYDQLEVTNDTLLRVELTSNEAISSGVEVTVPFNTVEYDERGEYNTTADGFSPDTDGWYDITGQVTFDTNSTGDNLVAKFRDKTGTTDLMASTLDAGGPGFNSLFFGGLLNLNSSHVYDVRAANSNNDDTVRGTARETYLTIRRAFR